MEDKEEATIVVNGVYCNIVETKTFKRIDDEGENASNSHSTGHEGSIVDIHIAAAPTNV